MAVPKKPAPKVAAKKPAPKPVEKKPAQVAKKPQVKKAEPVPAVEPPPQPPVYSGPMILMFENPTQVQHVKNLLAQPAMLDGVEVIIRARVLECFNQGVPLKEFTDRVITSYKDALQKQADREDYLKKAAEYEANKDLTAKTVIANTPQTILKGKR
jgi:hypothetical protein